MNENDKQAEPVAWLCEWEEGWHQYHDAADPLPDEWDDAPKKITPLYAHPDPAVAVNEQMLNALKLYIAHAGEPECAIWRHVQAKVKAAIAAAEAQIKEHGL